MAKAQQQGVSAITVWMIVFVFFWLVSTVWLVVLYTGQSELKMLSERLERDNRRLANPQEISSIEIVKNLPDGGPTAVGVLEESRAETAQLATGERKDMVAAVRTKRDALLKAIKADGAIPKPEQLEDVSLLQGMTLLYEGFQNEHRLRKAAEDRTAELEAEVAKLVQSTADVKSDFDKRTLGYIDQMSSIESDRVASRSEHDRSLSEREKQFEAHRTQTDADLTRERQRRGEAERQLAALRARIHALEEKFAGVQIGPQPLAAARQPDGKVLKAVPGDDVVYIDLGKKDRLVRGLKFAVYPGSEPIPVDGKAKAQIEVVSISPESAECAIKWVSPLGVIVENDWIANPIYDPDRAPNFVVLGEFDLNRDGVPDANGRAIIEAIVSEWGGNVTPEVTATTDFVVLGTPPPKPRLPQDPTPEQKSRYDSEQRIWERFTNTLQTANNLAVPILRQDVFLNFIGQPSSRFTQ